jgi:UDP-glucose 4-epimerase
VYRANFRGKRCMVTGGLGFIGSNLAHRLVELGAEVLLVDSMIPGCGGNMFNIAGIEDRVTVNISDVRDQQSMEYLVQGQDYIFNLAGQVAHLASMKDPFMDLEINCRAQLSLLEACRKYNPRVKIVYTSTRQIYGRPDYLPVDEKHLLRPTDINGVNKMAGEWYHILYNNVYGIRACALRLTNTYGPRLAIKLGGIQGFIGLFIRQAIDGETLQVWNGDQLRDLTYVDDVVEACLMAAASDVSNGQVFNLGGPRPISLRELAELIVEIAGSGSVEVRPFPEERKAIDVGSIYLDYSKIKRALGWEPKTSLEEGLARTIAFFRAHREHYWPK